MSEKSNLRDLFREYQAEMSSGLSKCRRIGHSTTKGDETESCWTNWFHDFLPSRYQVKKGIVVDSNGQMSDQIDIIVFDQYYSPFLFKGDLSVYIPAESVYAVFEVKQQINKENLVYAGRKVASVRKLHRTSAPIVHAGGKIQTPKVPFKIIGGILSYDVAWSKPFGSSFQKVLKSLPIDERIDMGCSIVNGSFESSYLEKEIVTTTEMDDSLIVFLLRFLTRLQELGTVPAIDLNEYLKFIKGK